MFEAEIQAAIDRQLELERKAAAWDELVRLVALGYTLNRQEDIDALWLSVHLAQSPSTS